MLNYKIIKKEKSGTYSNYFVYHIYRNVLGLKLWVKEADQYLGFFGIIGLLYVPSLLLSCGCSDFQTFSFIKTYSILAGAATLIFICFTKRKFQNYNDAEDHIKTIIRKRAKKSTSEVADFTFNNTGSNISKTINKNI